MLLNQNLEYCSGIQARMAKADYQKTVTLADVARAAGVSKGTASNVFNRPDIVREEVRLVLPEEEIRGWTGLREWASRNGLGGMIGPAGDAIDTTNFVSRPALWLVLQVLAPSLEPARAYRLDVFRPHVDQGHVFPVMREIAADVSAERSGADDCDAFAHGDPLWKVRNDDAERRAGANPPSSGALCPHCMSQRLQ